MSLTPAMFGRSPQPRLRNLSASGSKQTDRSHKPLLRRPRGSGGPGPRVRYSPSWMPAFAGKTKGGVGSKWQIRTASQPTRYAAASSNLQLHRRSVIDDSNANLQQKPGLRLKSLSRRGDELPFRTAALRTHPHGLCLRAGCFCRESAAMPLSPLPHRQWRHNKLGIWQFYLEPLVSLPL
jgi:hypothetical protein